MTSREAGSFVTPADMRMCLGDGPGDYSGPSLDFGVVDSEVVEGPSGAEGLSLVAGTSLYEDVGAVAQNLAVNPDSYEAVEVTIFARDYAFYTPDQGLMRMPVAPQNVAATYYVAHSAAGEEMIGLADENLNECGTSYEEGGYKWGSRSVN